MDKNQNSPVEMSEQTKKTLCEWALYLGKALLDAILLKLGFKRA